MSDLAEQFEAELADAKRRVDLEQKAAKAERLERELAFQRSGIPNNGFGKLFAQTYDGPADVAKIRSAWADVSGDDSFLSAAEKLHKELRAAQEEGSR